MNDISELKKIKIKIGLLGDQGVGKTGFVNSFISSSGDTTGVQSNFYNWLEIFFKLFFDNN